MFFINIISSSSDSESDADTYIEYAPNNGTIQGYQFEPMAEPSSTADNVSGGLSDRVDAEIWHHRMETNDW